MRKSLKTAAVFQSPPVPSQAEKSVAIFDRRARGFLFEMPGIFNPFARRFETKGSVARLKNARVMS